jgi:hypothetical protein
MVIMKLKVIEVCRTLLQTLFPSFREWAIQNSGAFLQKHIAGNRGRPKQAVLSKIRGVENRDLCLHR